MFGELFFPSLVLLLVLSELLDAQRPSELSDLFEAFLFELEGGHDDLLLVFLLHFFM